MGFIWEQKCLKLIVGMAIELDFYFKWGELHGV